MKSKFAAILVFLAFFAFAEDPNFDVSTFFADVDVRYEPFAELLEAYKKNDISMEKARIALETAQNNYSLFKTQNGFDLTISSGTVSVPFSDEGAFSMNPSAKVELPDLRGLEIDATAPVSASVGGNKATSVNGAGVSASIDLINTKIGERDISRIQAERNLVEAQRDYSAKSDEVEQNFWNDVQSVYSAALALLDAQKTLYNEELDFQVAKTQGYGRNSATYRQKEIKVMTAKNNIFDNEQDFRAKLALFAQKTGNAEFIIPIDIPEVELVKFEDFAETDFLKIESAEWNEKIAEMKRDANKNFSLGANAGYKYYDNAGMSHGDGAHEIQAGIDAGYRGFDFGIGISAPLNNAKGTTGNFSIGWNLSEMFSTKYQNRALDLSIASAQANLAEARENYGISKTEREQKYKTLLWKMDLQKEELDIYRKYLTESKTWFNQGLITKSQLAQAERDWQNALAGIIKCRIDLMIYNLSTKAMFVK